MTHYDCIKGKPWLKLVNRNKITDRLLEATKGNAFVVWNNIQQTYELHTIEAYRLSGDSYNTSIPIDILNSFIIWDYKINDFAKNLDEFISEKMMHEHRKERMVSREQLLTEQLKSIGRVLGTSI